MKRFNKRIIVLILLTCIALILKKRLIPGASTLLVITLSTLAILFFILAFRSLIYLKDQTSPPPLFILAYFSFSISCVAFLFQIHYWEGARLLLWVGFICLALLALLLVYYFLFHPSTAEAKSRIYKELLLPLLFFLCVIPFSVVANQRQFHNFFKGSTYESYIRKTYPENEAQPLLEANQCTDKSCIEKAEEYYREGLKKDSLKQYAEAYECYNKAIDYNIHFADAYYHRASDRMLRSLIDDEVVRDALLDCKISIQLKPDFALYYLRRAFIYVHTRERNKACVDFVKAKRLDNTLKIEKYIKSNCGNAAIVQ